MPIGCRNAAPSGLHRRFCISLLLLSGVACAGGSGCPDNDFRFRDPVLRIASAKSSQTGAAITQVTLSEITIAGVRKTEADVQFYTRHELSRSIFGDGDRVVCNVECAFGVEEGLWKFTISAPGFQSKTVSYPVRYAGTERDDCTVYSVGSFSVDVSLDPVP